MFNGLLKIPMQFIILFIGVLVFVFYLFFQPPVFYNQVLRDRALTTPMADSVRLIEKQFADVYSKKRVAVDEMVKAIQGEDDKQINLHLDQVKGFQVEENALRNGMKKVIARAIPNAKTQDRDYIFFKFCPRLFATRYYRSIAGSNFLSRYVFDGRRTKCISFNNLNRCLQAVDQQAC